MVSSAVEGDGVVEVEHGGDDGGVLEQTSFGIGGSQWLADSGGWRKPVAE